MKPSWQDSEDVSIEKWSGRCTVDHFVDGAMRLQAKECGQPLDAGKDRERDYPLEPSEKTSWFLAHIILLTYKTVR